MHNVRAGLANAEDLGFFTNICTYRERQREGEKERERCVRVWELTTASPPRAQLGQRLSSRRRRSPLKSHVIKKYITNGVRIEENLRLKS